MHAKPPSRPSLPKPPRLITKDYLRNSGLYYLGRYAASTVKFKSIMLRKIEKSIAHHGKPSKSDAVLWLDEVTVDFTRLGYLNDELYQQSLERGLKQKGLSKRVVEQKMALKGVRPENLEVDDLTQILKLMKRKKWGIFRQENSAEIDSQKLLARLARNGFSFEICQKAMNMSVDEIEDYLNI